MTRTSNPCAVVLAFAAIAASGTAMAANTITFSGEVTDQTCQVAVNGFTDPTVILDSVPVSALDGAVGRSAGETAFTLQLTDCVAPTADEHLVPAGDIVLANGATSTSYDYAVQYVSEAATVTPGPVLGAVTYTLRYE
ncbi:fimbrial protein [Pseudomonas aeruginosa]|nr:fimbrial protein [Pseudomonas aeruginosa]